MRQRQGTHIFCALRGGCASVQGLSSLVRCADDLVRPCRNVYLHLKIALPESPAHHKGSSKRGVFHVYWLSTSLATIMKRQ